MASVHNTEFRNDDDDDDDDDNNDDDDDDDDDECLHKLHWFCLAWTNPVPLCDLKRKFFEPCSMKLKTSHQNVSPSNYFDQGRFGDQLQTFSRMIPTSNLLCPKQISSTSSTETPKSINKLFFSTTTFKQRSRRDIVPATFVCCLLRHGCAWLRANKWPAASEHLAVPEVGGSVLLKQQAPRIVMCNIVLDTKVYTHPPTTNETWNMDLNMERLRGIFGEKVL